jgi:flavorubredoxin
MELLMPNDAFGQHIASTGRFDDQVDECTLMKEARTYYANILTPYSPLVLKKISEVQTAGLKIKTIAPSHGIIWRSDPGKIIEAYRKWATGEAATTVVVAYETMWGGTEAMARRIVEGLKSKGVTAKMYKLSATDRSTVISEILEAKAVVIGSSTINNGVLPQVAEILSELKGLKFRDRIGAAFGCYGWRGVATKIIQAGLEEAGIQIARPALDVNWSPDQQKLEECFKFGAELADKLQ